MSRFLSKLEDEAPPAASLVEQSAKLVMHIVLAVGCWVLLMVFGYFLDPFEIAQSTILMLSIALPLIVGFLVSRIHPDETATILWLIGLIWMLVMSLWVLDLPTGPNACNECDATGKLLRTFFSIPQPSGLMDDDGPFLATWPAAALIGYSLGARLGMRKTREKDEEDKELRHFPL